MCTDHFGGFSPKSTELGWMWSSRSSRKVLAKEKQNVRWYEHVRTENTSNWPRALSPVGTRVVNARSISKKPRHDALQDNIRITCATQTIMRIKNDLKRRKTKLKIRKDTSYCLSLPRLNTSTLLIRPHMWYKITVRNVPSLEVRGTLNLFIRRRSCSRTVTARSRPL